jgi:hypothetical protein
MRSTDLELHKNIEILAEGVTLSIKTKRMKELLVCTLTAV